ncbi:Rap1 GTPase-activating protein 2 [Gryganskiella cystojenkinii]|nr:Rap1 GTPase-activating protein 2 [Gryganskiella cystojenkinii]
MSSIADIMESSRELHPHNSGDVERLELYSHLGMQEIHYSTLTGEDPAHIVMQQLYGTPSVAKDGSTPSSAIDEPRESTTMTSITHLTSSLNDIPTEDPSTIIPGNDGKTHHRLGRFGRFKFPSLSMSSIHKSHKSTSSLEPKKVAPLITGSAPTLNVVPVPPAVAGPSSSQPAQYHSSNSASTFASSFNTANMTSNGASSGSSSNSSISSYNALERGRQLQRKQTSQPQLPRFSNGGPATNKSLHFGSERFTKSTTSSQTQEDLQGFGPIHAHGSHGPSFEHKSGFRSNLLRRSSRRTMSASHISSDEIFVTKSTFSQDAKSTFTVSCRCGDSLYCVCRQPNVTPFRSERDRLSTESTKALKVNSSVARDGSVRTSSEYGRRELQSPLGERSVGRYLFGSELRGIAFGDHDSGLGFKVDNSSRDDIATKYLESDVEERRRMELSSALTGPAYAPHQQLPSRPQTPSLMATSVPSEQSTLALAPVPCPSVEQEMSMPNPGSTKNHVAGVIAKDGGLRRISDPMLRKMTSALSERRASGQRAISTTSISSMEQIPRSPARSSNSVGNNYSSSSSTVNMPKMNMPSPALSISSSPPSAGPGKKRDHGKLSVSSVMGRSSSPAPPSPLGPSAAGYSSFFGHTGLPSTPSGAGSSLKSKFSIPGITSHSPYHHVPFSAYLPRRPSISQTVFSSSSSAAAAAAASNAAAAAGSSSSSSRPPNMLHLEPRSAIADYSGSSILYKRQRSMSLQDADLLTADQFIALMPGGISDSEDTPPKRRFSSEETLQNNPWYMRPKVVPIPDPIVTLRTHQDTLRSKCDLVSQFILEVNSPIASNPERSFTNSESTLSSSKTLEGSGSESTLDETASGETGHQKQAAVVEHNTSTPQTLILVQDAADSSSVEEKPQRTIEGFDSTKESPPQPDPIAVLDIQAGKTSDVIATTTTAVGVYRADRTELRLDLIETVGLLLEDIERIVGLMADILTKHISTTQLLKLMGESDDMCYIAQEVFRSEVERRKKWLNENQPLHPCPTEAPSAFGSEQRTGERRPSDAILTVDDADDTGSSDAESTLLSLEEALKEMLVERDRAETQKKLKKKESNDRMIRQRRSMDIPCKPQYRYRGPPGSYPRKSLDISICCSSSVLSDERLQEHRNSLNDYIRMVLEMAEISITEFIRVYNRMFIAPTARYRIEGYSMMRGGGEGDGSASSSTTGVQPSLVSRVTIMQDSQFFESPTTTPTLDRMSGADMGTGELMPTTDNSIASLEFTPGSDPLTSPDDPRDGTEPQLPVSSFPFGTNTATDASSNVTSNSGDANGSHLNGQPMARVKSLPESRDEWAAFQKGKELGEDTTGVGGANTMGAESSNRQEGDRIGNSPSSAMMPDLSMLGEYSQDHMGHEAYYYRNWFLGREHRTFVGQVEGLGTVIISIIKDMVVPTESRSNVTKRASTGPFAAYVSANSATTPSTPLSGSFGNPISTGAHAAIIGSTMRPELVHSTHSYYHPRGASLGYGHGHTIPGGGYSITNSRTSSEAMRVIHSASSNSSSPGSGAEYASSYSFPAVPNSGAQNHTAASSTAVSHSQPSFSHPHHQHQHQNGQPIQHHSQLMATNLAPFQSTAPARWQYRCILRQKDVDSIRITLPEPEPSSPLNNLTRRAGKPQWKAILQSIHPAITQQVATKLKKVQNNQHFEKELAKFDETMLRFNYKFGVLLVLPGQVKEEDWFSNQMADSQKFREFLESGALGQKVFLKGFERFSAGLDTRSETGEYSYYDTWGEDGSFEIMYHVSTLLPFNTVDRQQIQRKRHIGNDIVCIVFVDGDQPFYPSAIKSQFLHIFVVIHPILLPDGQTGYSAAIACDEQVPEFGPPLPSPDQPLIFRTAQELRAFLLCKMINGENAAYKAPRLIKPHQRARSGMLENLVVKANTLAREKDKDKEKEKDKSSVGKAKPQKAATAPAAVETVHGSHVSTAGAAAAALVTPPATSDLSNQLQHQDESDVYDHQNVHPLQQHQTSTQQLPCDHPFAPPQPQQNHQYQSHHQSQHQHQYQQIYAHHHQHHQPHSQPQPLIPSSHPKHQPIIPYHPHILPLPHSHLQHGARSRQTVLPVREDTGPKKNSSDTPRNVFTSAVEELDVKEGG